MPGLAGAVSPARLRMVQLQQPERRSGKLHSHLLSSSKHLISNLQFPFFPSTTDPTHLFRITSLHILECALSSIFDLNCSCSLLYPSRAINYFGAGSTGYSLRFRSAPADHRASLLTTPTTFPPLSRFDLKRLPSASQEKSHRRAPCLPQRAESSASAG